MAMFLNMILRSFRVLGLEVQARASAPANHEGTPNHNELT
jgi:hypothetical protein